MHRPVFLLAALAVLLAGVPAAGTSYVPPNAKNVRWWLGSWDTNFGVVLFTQIYHAKSDVADANGNPQYYWRAEGFWTMPGGRRVKFHGAIDPRDHLTYQGCYETRGPYGGTACYPMLMYGNDASDRISHGYWKPCFLPENCHSHHPWTGDHKHHAWRAGFQFTQRGIPDGQTTIRTQTGGAGSLLFDGPPVANDKKTATVRDTGYATHGSKVITIDEIPEGTNLTTTVEIRRGFYRSYGTRHTPARKATIEGLVESSNDPHCHAGQYAAVTLYDRPQDRPDRIELRIDGCRTETWTSTSRDKVLVHLDAPREFG